MATTIGVTATAALGREAPFGTIGGLLFVLNLDLSWEFSAVMSIGLFEPRAMEKTLAEGAELEVTVGGIFERRGRSFVATPSISSSESLKFTSLSSSLTELMRGLLAGGGRAEGEDEGGEGVGDTSCLLRFLGVPPRPRSIRI